MIREYTDKNLFESDANILINLINLHKLLDVYNLNLPTRLRHVEKECRKYIRYCDKNNIDIIGSVQYVPVDTWALIMVDTMRNKNIIKYDKKYQYVANAFYCDTDAGDLLYNIGCLIKKVCIMAESINAKTIAISDRFQSSLYYNQILENYKDIEILICCDNL